MKIKSSCNVPSDGSDYNFYELQISELTKKEQLSLISFAIDIASNETKNQTIKTPVLSSVITTLSDFDTNAPLLFMPTVNSAHDEENVLTALQSKQKQHPSIKKLKPKLTSVAKPVAKPTPPMYYGVPTVKHRLFEHIIKRGNNGMRYTDIIKWLLKTTCDIELTPSEPLGVHRGFYAGALASKPRYFLTPGRDGRYLHKRSDGLYELKNPRNIQY